MSEMQDMAKFMNISPLAVMTDEEFIGLLSLCVAFPERTATHRHMQGFLAAMESGIRYSSGFFTSEQIRELWKVKFAAEIYIEAVRRNEMLPLE
jgi:hypothetical protein